MVFSNAVFLFLFLPITLIGYYNPVFKSIRFRNIWLLLVSLGFYAWGEPFYIVLMLSSIIVNYFLALIVEKHSKSKKGRLIVAIACIYNLGVLFVFKYLSWILRDIFHITENQTIFASLALPIGISFYTFQSLSYVIDVYRGSEKAQKNILDAGLYIAFFPQLIAGPIVRYGTVSKQLVNRVHNNEFFSEGVRRFIIGLSKKLLIANTVAPVAYQAFQAVSEGEVCSVLLAWAGVFAFMLQIYFDFSGYSDMAIGLGKMFGFEFLENFNYPYISESIGEYWRRWHISLGQWFTDYLFAPVSSTLGKRVRKFTKKFFGNKIALKAEYISSIFVVWLATGLWHGANWNFLAWGLMNFVFIVIETLFSSSRKNNLQKTAFFSILRIVRMWFLMLMLLTMFNSSSFSTAISYYANLFHFTNNPLCDEKAIYFISQYKVFLLLGFLFCFPVTELFFSKVIRNKTLTAFIQTILLILLFIIDICYCVGGGYNPFIYFNF